MTQDPEHPIISKPWEYDIVGLCYHQGEDEPCLDLTLEKGSIVRRLRFFSPRNLVIEAGFPMPTRGMLILDVRHRQMEGIGVQVTDFEASAGSVMFWARDVLDLDRTQT